jgi:hypothetical protein
MRFSLATISICVLAVAASAFADNVNTNSDSNKVTEGLDFKLSSETINSINDNGYVQILPYFAIITPKNAVPDKIVREPDTKRPNTIIFNDADSNCIYWARVKRSAMLKRLKEITFMKCGSEEQLAKVNLERSIITGEIDVIEIKMPFDRKETISTKRTLIRGNYKEIKVERNWTKDYVTKVEVPRTFFLGRPKSVKTTAKTLV